jgi:hypothetical protein
MTFPPKYTAEQWAQARRLRAEGLSYPDIARRLGMASAKTIAARARRQGWSGGAAAAGRAAAPRPAAASAAASAPAAARRAASRAASPATFETRRRLGRRLYRIIGVRIRTMELSMHKQLRALEGGDDSVATPAAIKDESEAFATVVQNINQVTEMASEPASAAAGRRKSVNPELTALSDDIDPDALALASEKDRQRAALAQQLAKVVGPA